MQQERIMPHIKQELLQQGSIAVTPTPETPPEQVSATTARAYDVADELDQLRRYQELEQRTMQLEKERSNAPQAQVLCVEQATEVEDEATKPKEVGKVNGCRLVTILPLLIVIVVVATLIIVFGISHRDNEDKSESDIFNDTSSTGHAFVPTTSPSTSLQSQPPTAIITSSPLPPTLQMIHARDFIRCCDLQLGRFALDMCSAFAAGILGNETKFQLDIIPFTEQFISIANGTCDIAVSPTVATFQRDIYEPTSQRGMQFMIQPPTSYGGDTFVGLPEYVQCADNGDSLIGICRGLSICYMYSNSVQTLLIQQHLPGSTTHAAGSFDEIFQSLSNGTCNVLVGPPPILTERTARSYNYTGPYLFASNLFTRSTPSFTTRQNDAEFGDMISWLYRSLVIAEVLNITKETSDEFPSTNVFGSNYTNIFQNAISVVGHFGEFYMKYVDSYLPRDAFGSINTPHLTKEDGGLLYPYPFGKLDEAFSASSLSSNKPILTTGGTLETIEGRHALYCGIVADDMRRDGLVLWNETSNEWIGIDVDYCRGLAAALFAGDVKIDSTLFLMQYQSMEDAFVALGNGEIDVLAGAVYNLENDIKQLTTNQGFAFGDIYYYYSNGDTNSATSIEAILPMSMATRQDDAQWSDFVRLMIASTIYAEDNNITQTTAGEMTLLELFGGTGTYRQALRYVILSIGNYAEIYQRNMETFIPRVNNTRNTLNDDGSPMFFANWDFSW